MLLRSFAQTGLFILAHDAMHGSLLPHRPHLNRWIGQGCLWAYGLLSFERCCRNHSYHHQFTGLVQDPDAPPLRCQSMLGRHSGTAVSALVAAAWYCKFLKGYCSFSQISALLVGWLAISELLYQLAAIGPWKTLAVLVVPLVLSSWQLFIFGTYLPHRGLLDSAQAGSTLTTQSSHLPPGLAFLTCYYFGYHREHHRNPQLPWYRLSQARWPKKYS